jgi:UDP-glucose 4-epimerase
MRHVLITGCRGFIGRHLARRLTDAGYAVVGIGHGAWPQHEHQAWGVREWCNADVTRTNLEAVAGGTRRIELVFHLAGGSSVAPSLMLPAEDFRRSVGSTLEVLEWCRNRDERPALVLASSAAVYGDQFSGPVRASDRGQPKSPYGHHKLISEQLVRSYAESFAVDASIVRLFSVYGPELRKQLLWDACQKLRASAGALTLAGTGEELRDWLHVADAASILEHASHRVSRECPVIHGATGIPVSVRQIGDALSAAFGAGRDAPSFTGQVRAGDPRQLVSHADDVPDIGPMRPWTTGVAEYVSWFRRESERGQS